MQHSLSECVACITSHNPFNSLGDISSWSLHSRKETGPIVPGATGRLRGCAAIGTLRPRTWIHTPWPPLCIGRHKQLRGMTPVIPQPSQPRGSSCGPFRVMAASSWLWPHVASSPRGSDSNPLREGTKASLLASSLETLTSCFTRSCLDWLLPWQLAADLCPIMSAQPEGPLCPFPGPACQHSPSDLQAVLKAQAF